MKRKIQYGLILIAINQSFAGANIEPSQSTIPTPQTVAPEVSAQPAAPLTASSNTVAAPVAPMATNTNAEQQKPDLRESNEPKEGATVISDIQEKATTLKKAGLLQKKVITPRKG